MRFQIASDLHLEMLTRFPGYRVIEPAPEADALLLAGDIHEHTHAIEAFADWPVPVLYVHGNHEPFNAHYWGLVKEISRASLEAGVHYLERRSVILGDVRILGSCLWTDYSLAGDRFSVMNQARRTMPEHQLVRTRRQGYFGPEEAYLEFQRTRAWLEKELARPFEGKTVVMTHHAPHPKSIAPKYAKDPLSGATCRPLCHRLICGFTVICTSARIFVLEDAVCWPIRAVTQATASTQNRPVNLSGKTCNSIQRWSLKCNAVSRCD
jgi:hypothetical protein